MKKKNVIFTANRGYALKSSRMNIIKRFLDAGYTVVIATAEDEESRYIEECGAVLEEVSFNRGGLAPLMDYKAFYRLKSIFRKYRPILVHNFHAKPVILGSIAARSILKDNVKIINTITGLGHAFIKGGITSKLAGIGYKLALQRSDITIFQNSDDFDLFIGKKWSSKEKSILIPSSGVDIKKFSYKVRNAKKNNIKIIMLGRLIKQKGIPEFIKIAENITRDFPSVKFLLAGEEDLIHPDAVTKEWVESHDSVKYIGRLSNVIPLLENADILLFPSYREGVPRVILESAATGLPTVAFDVPGVREAVVNNETGFLVPFKDIELMQKKLVNLIKDNELRVSMGRKARLYMENKFDYKKVEEQYIRIYQKCGLNV